MKTWIAATGALLAAATFPPAPAGAQAPAAIAAVDPARLAAAAATVDHIFPTGTYAKMMDGPIQALMDSTVGASGQIRLQQVARMVGMKTEEIAALSDATLNAILLIFDPAYKERMNLTIEAMMPTLGRLMTEFEPGMREGLARAYARRFTREQLEDMNRFFATPSGSAYAANSLLIQLDPEVMAKMNEGMPLIIEKLMADMPALAKKVEAAAAKLPKERAFKDLSDAERARLAKLLGVSIKQLNLWED